MELLSFQKMYGLWGYLLKAKALAPINAGRVFEGGWYLKGVAVNNTEIKLSQYADDTTLILNGEQESLSAALNIL